MEEINEKKTLKRVIGLAISIIIILVFFVFKTHNNQNRILIILGVIISSVLVLSFLLINKLSIKTKNYYFQAVDFMLMLNGAIIFVQVFFTFAFYPATVSGSSMLPTLKNGDTLIVQTLGRPTNGDIVVARIEGYPDPLVKRVIGIPGDELYFTEERVLFVNGEMVDELYLNEGDDFFDIECRVDSPCIIPDDSYYLMGDNRRWSEDSRAFGVVLNKDIMGVVRRRKISFFNWEKL